MKFFNTWHERYVVRLVQSYSGMVTGGSCMQQSLIITALSKVARQSVQEKQT